MSSFLIEEDSKSSDEEFWQSIEKPKLPEKQKRQTTVTEHKKFISLRPSEKERYEKTITNLRDSRQEEMKNLEIKTRNQTKKELFASVNELRINFQKEAMRLQETYADSRSNIQKKDAEIIYLIKIVSDQEHLITNMRLEVMRIRKSKQSANVVQVDIYKDQAEALKLQLQALKLVCDEYKTELDKYKSLNEKLSQENEVLKNDVQKLSNELANISNEQSEKFQKENESLKNEFGRIRAEMEKEIEIREVINKRQEQVISSLQEEMKNMKLVINTPRIRYKVFERLKDQAAPEKINEKKSMPNKNKSVPRYFYNMKNKAHSNYSYKEYKAFNSEDSRFGLQALRTVSVTPRIDMVKQRSSNLTLSNDSKIRLSKGSVLYYNSSPDDS